MHRPYDGEHSNDGDFRALERRIGEGVGQRPARCQRKVSLCALDAVVYCVI